jgi:cytochrome c-type biogenesis protein CcmH/NrfG
VLLDQKRTRRMVQVVSVLTSLAFAGVIFVVLGLIFFGGGGTTLADEQLSTAKSLVQKQPKSADAWEQLASAYAGKSQFGEATAAATKASALDPGNFRRLQTLVSLQVRQKNTSAAIDTVQKYTAKHPDNAEAFVQLAQLAESGGKTALSRLSYQTFLRLAPNDPNATAIRAHLKTLPSK